MITNEIALLILELIGYIGIIGVAVYLTVWLCINFYRFVEFITTKW